jgi:hypothetical protein
MPHWPTIILILFTEDSYSSAGLGALGQDRRAVTSPAGKRSRPASYQAVMRWLLGAIPIAGA